MISNDSPSITLDEADQKKIGLVQNRLTVLQSEVLEATKTLDAIEKALEQGQQNKEYYDTLIESLKPEVVSLENKRDALKADIISSEDTLREHQAQHESMNLHHDAKKKEHDERESTVQGMNTNAVKKENELNAYEKHLVQREEKIIKSEQAFRAALESLT